MSTPCTLEEVCEKVNCLDADLQILWNDRYGLEEQVYLATGNTGVPTLVSPIADDSQEYLRGAALINSMNPAGLFLTGDANYDVSDRLSGLNYNLVNQESKIYSGFANLVMNKKVFPVIGELDYWIAHDRLVGTIEQRMNDTYLRIFPYLPDAKRYYSVYDEKSNTEFYILSSGLYMNYAIGNSSIGAIYPNDTQIGGAQYNWLLQRTASTPAKNKVVIFHHPFVAIADVFKGEVSQGDINIYEGFDTWDFQAMGIKLIITGHTGFGTHFKKSSINMVNASSFCRSRNSYMTANGNNPPLVETYFGQVGWALEYYSHFPVADGEPRNIFPPDNVGDYVFPKNEVFKMRCTRSGIICEFISYDPYASDMEATIESMVVEHSFEISANQ